MTWPVQKVDEVAIFLNSRRVPVKAADRAKRQGQYPYYGASGIVDWVDDYIFDGEYLLISEDGENLRSRNAPIAFLARGKYWVNNHAHILDEREPGILRYLSWALNRTDLSPYITGAAQPKLNKRTLADVEVAIRPLPERLEIIGVLGALDDKIELNRRMSATLEEMARALYRSWFVDFDPVHARALGQPPAHMDPTTAALFPDTFGPDGLPKGWEAGTLGDIASNIRRQVQPGDIEADTPYIGLEHMPRRSIALSDWGEAGQVGSAKSAMRRGQILFGKLRPYFHKVGIVPIDGICSTDILVIDAKADRWRELVFSVVSSDDFVEHANATSSGTRMPRSNWKDMTRFDIAIPPSPTG